LIRETSLANPLWGAPRIHGELLKLGIDVGQTSVAKHLPVRRRPPSQRWKTFLRNPADGIVAMDLLVELTLTFRWLYGLLILQHGPRQMLWLGLSKDAPMLRAAQFVGAISSTPILGGLHHRYGRI